MSNELDKIYDEWFKKAKDIEHQIGSLREDLDRLNSEYLKRIDLARTTLDNPL